MHTLKQDITIEEIRHISGMENLTDEDLLTVINSIKEFSLILQLIPSIDKVIKK